MPTAECKRDGFVAGKLIDRNDSEYQGLGGGRLFKQAVAAETERMKDGLIMHYNSVLTETGFLEAGREEIAEKAVSALQEHTIVFKYEDGNTVEKTLVEYITG